MFLRAVTFLLLFPLMCFAKPLDKVAAIVNDSVITESELSAQVELLRAQIEAKRMEVPSEKALRRQVLDHLIDVELQLSLAKQHRLSVEETEIDRAIEKIASRNNLSLDAFQEALKGQGLSWKQYRENLKKEMILARLQQKAVAKDVMVSEEQIEDYMKNGFVPDRSQFVYHLQNIVVPLSEEPSPEQVLRAKNKALELLKKIKKGEDFNRIAIEQSSGEFALEGGDLGKRHLAELPELFAKEVIKMKAGEVAGPLRAGNGFQLIKLISASDETEKYKIQKTHVRHILLKPDASMTPEEVYKQAKNISTQLRAGKNFALMAKQYSLDAQSALNGGDLGWVGPGELIPEFEQAMTKLALHQISEPVKSVFGWHIIEVLERKKINDAKGYQRAQIKRFLEERKFIEAVQNWQQHLRATAYINIIDQTA